MKRWRVIYGGMKIIEAETEGQAYELFWQWLEEKIQDGEVGLVMPDEVSRRGTADDP